LSQLFSILGLCHVNDIEPALLYFRILSGVSTNVTDLGLGGFVTLPILIQFFSILGFYWQNDTVANSHSRLA